MAQYEYKVVPAPRRGLKGKGIKGAESRFAHAIQTLMNTQSDEGWEFLRAETLASEEPNQLAFVGYDLGRFLTRVLVTDDGRDLMERIRFAPPFQGLAVKVNFGGGNVNQAMFYERYRNGRTELLR